MKLSKFILIVASALYFASYTILVMEILGLPLWFAYIMFIIFGLGIAAFMDFIESKNKNNKK